LDSNDLINSVAKIFSEPDGQEKLDKLTGMLSGNGGSGKDEDPFGAQMISYVGRFMESFNRHDNRIDLLNAIRPYIKSGRAGNLDMAIRIIRLLNIAGDFKEGGVKNVSDLHR